MALPAFRGDRDECEPGRKHECLLGSTDQDIDAPAIHGQVARADSADGVHDAKGFSAPAQRGELLDRMHDAGG
jgi:hypothetical protein